MHAHTICNVATEHSTKSHMDGDAGIGALLTANLCCLFDNLRQISISFCEYLTRDKQHHGDVPPAMCAVACSLGHYPKTGDI